MLYSLNDQDGVEPEERSDEGEKSAVENFECPRAEGGAESFADAGEILWAVALADEEDEGDGETD